MKVRDIMTHEITVCSVMDSIRDVAAIMAERDLGLVPVRNGDDIVGVVTDRDIVVRAVSHGLHFDRSVVLIITGEVICCAEDDQIDHAAAKMADYKIRRLPVLNRSGGYVGIVSLGDIAVAKGPDTAGEALEELSLPGERHFGDEPK